MRTGIFVVVCLLTLSTSSCTLISDLDRFEVDEASGKGTNTAARGCGNPRTFCLQLERFGTHKAVLGVADLVSSDRKLRARALLDPMTDGGERAELVLPLAIADRDLPASGDPHPLHLELWADVNRDREYTPTPASRPQIDHEWRLELPASATLSFTHDTNFQSLDPQPTPIGGPFIMRVRDFDEVHPGQMFEVLVIERDTGRAVGFYRLQAIPADESSFEIVIPGIIESFATYEIQYWVDVNGDGAYTGVGPDHSWIDVVEADEDELDVDVRHSGNTLTELTYWLPFEL